MKREDIIKNQLNLIYGKTTSYFDTDSLYPTSQVYNQNPRGVGRTAYKNRNEEALVSLLKKELEKHVKGYISTHIVEGTLIVTIQATDKLIFRYTQNHITTFQCIDVTRYAELILEKHYFPYIANIFIKENHNEK